MGIYIKYKTITEGICTSFLVWTLQISNVCLKIRHSVSNHNRRCMNYISGSDPPNFKGFLKIRCLEGSKQIWFQFVEYWCFFDLFLEGIKNLKFPLNFICPPSKLHEGSKQIWSQFVENASFFDVFLEGIKNSKDPLNFICPPNKLHEGLKQNWNFF